MQFSKSQQQSTAAEVAAALLALVQGRDAAESRLLMDATLDRRTLNAELIYLRIIAVEYGVAASLTGRVLDRVMRAFTLRVKEVSEQSPELGDAFLRQIVQRSQAYQRAIETPHPQGAPWQVGRVFSQLCGGGTDANVIMYGSVEFTGTAQAASEFLKSMTIG